jgi:hypothetical protein
MNISGINGSKLLKVTIAGSLCLTGYIDCSPEDLTRYEIGDYHIQWKVCAPKVSLERTPREARNYDEVGLRGRSARGC